MLLDPSGGPTCIGPDYTSVCTPDIGHCDAPILADTGKQTLEYRDTFYHMGHFSRHIPRGSVRVGTKAGGFSADPDATAPLNFLAVLTPAGRLVVVVLNTAKDGADYQLEIGGRYARATILSTGDALASGCSS